jgi:isochorismate hydrolase
VNDIREGKNRLISKKDAVLIIIEMQERLVAAVADREGVIQNNVRLAKFSKIIGLPVILAEQFKLGDTIPEIRNELKDIEPIVRSEFNCFGSEAFRERLGRLKRYSLIITGLEAHICVAQTALYALSDYAVHVVGDAVSSRFARNYETALNRMSRAGVTITSTEMVIYELLEKAGTDVFKKVLKLVK